MKYTMLLVVAQGFYDVTSKYLYRRSFVRSHNS